MTLRHPPGWRSDWSESGFPAGWTLGVIVDLGCGSNPLRDLPCQSVIGIDRHGVNGGLIGDSAATGLEAGAADFVVMSLSIWGSPADRIAYLQEAKRLLRPLGKLIIVGARPSLRQSRWCSGVAKFRATIQKLGMHVTEVRQYSADSGTALISFVVDNSAMPPESALSGQDGVWSAS